MVAGLRHWWGQRAERSSGNAGCTFTGFAQQQGAAVLLAERARGTFSRCAFSDNAGTPAPPAAVAPAPGRGPALGLRGGSEAASYSAAWLQGCSFERNTAEVRGAASAENARCRVFSDNAAAPEVFVESLGRTEAPWWLVEAGGTAAGAAAGGRAGGFAGVDFATGASPALVRVLQARRPPPARSAPRPGLGNAMQERLRACAGLPETPS